MDDTAWRKGIAAPAETHEFPDDVQEESGQMGAAWRCRCLRELEVSFVTPPLSMRNRELILKVIR